MKPTDWVVLKRFQSRNEALLLRALLDSEGIRSLIPNEHTSSIQPWTTVNEIHVLVQAQDVLRAEQVLEAMDRSPMDH